MPSDDDPAYEDVFSDATEDSDSQADAPAPVTDLEIWQDYTSEFTVQGYHYILDFFQRLGVPVLDRCTYHDFAQFCFERSSGFVPRC